MSLLPYPLSTWQQTLQENPSSPVALEIIEEYFSFFGLQKAKEELWLLTTATLTSEEVEHYNSAGGRANLLFYFEFTKMFMEAVHSLHCTEKAVG